MKYVIFTIGVVFLAVATFHPEPQAGLALLPAAACFVGVSKWKS